MGRSIQMKRGLLAVFLFGLISSSSAFAGVQVKEPGRQPAVKADPGDGAQNAGAIIIWRQNWNRAGKAVPGDEPQNTGAVIIWLQNWMSSHLKK